MASRRDEFFDRMLGITKEEDQRKLSEAIKSIKLSINKDGGDNDDVHLFIDKFTELQLNEKYKDVEDEYSDVVDTHNEFKEVEKEVDYSKLGQSELNYQLNKAMDNNDLDTVKKISLYLKESKNITRAKLVKESLDELS